jgi:hypothetical protein
MLLTVSDESESTSHCVMSHAVHNIASMHREVPQSKVVNPSPAKAL